MHLPSKLVPILFASLLTKFPDLHLFNFTASSSFSDDHSRVILSYIENIPGSDYINANYVDVSRSSLYSFLFIQERDVSAKFFHFKLYRFFT